MVHPSIPQKPIDWRAYDQWTGTDKAFAASIGMDPNNFAQYKRRHLRNQAPGNGNLSAIPAAHSDAPERISAVPVHYDASALDDLTSRLATLEAFVAAMQQAQQRISAVPAHSDAFERISETLAQLDSRLQAVETAPQLSALPAHRDASVHHNAPQRTEPPQWVNRGTHLAADMVDAIKAYAAEHRLEIREVIDQALRNFFAQVAEGVHDA